MGSKGFGGAVPALGMVLGLAGGLQAQGFERVEPDLGAPGQVDLTFDAGTVTSSFGSSDVTALLVLPDGKILIGGFFTHVQGVSRIGLARLHPNGALDTTFVPPFPVAASIPQVFNLAVQPDGRILVAGNSLNVAGVPYSIARLNPNGSLDPSFNLLPMAVSFGIQGLLLLPDGRILIGGDFSNIGPLFTKTMARLLPDGTRDVTFDFEPTTDAYGGRVTTIVAQPDGNFLIGGDFQFQVGTQFIDRLARIRPDATIDTSFDLEFNLPEGPVVRSIVLRPDGAMYVGGQFSRIGGIARPGIARVTSAGVVDPAFNTASPPASYWTIVRQADGKLLVTGDFFLPPDRWGVARLDETGVFDSFSPPLGLGPGIGHAMAVQSDLKVLVGGLFTNPGGIARERVVRLLNDPAANNPPNAVDDTAVTPEDTAVTINVTANDTDPDGHPLTVSAVTAPAHGTAAISGSGTVLYTPAGDYNGPDAFTYTVSDGNGGTDVANVTVTVTPVNDPPVATPQSVVTSEDVVLGIVLSGTDADGNPLTYSIVAAPTHGTLSGVAPNLDYAPAAHYNGPDAFTFRVHDGLVSSASATVSITVDPVNDPPVAANDSYATPAGTPLSVAAPGVLANDTDVEGAALTASVVTSPASGSLTLSANGSLTYTPATGFTGVATFTYRASDGVATSNLAIVTITIGTPPAWVAAGVPNVARASHTATLLNDGRVLVVGGQGAGNAPITAEVFNPATGAWTFTSSLNRQRMGHTATLLADGRVLVAGSNAGAFGNAVAASAEIFDPTTGLWTLTGSSTVAHGSHAAVRLANGKVLVAGGIYAPLPGGGGGLVKASLTELYDPATGTWSVTGELPLGRVGHQATLLANGRVLVTGGTVASMFGSNLRRSDVYDPATGTWTPSGDMSIERSAHTATLLADGTVVVGGGATASTAERYDPTAGTWSATGPLTARSAHQAVRLGSGRVLAAGGLSTAGAPLATTALFDPTTGLWAASTSMFTPRREHSLTRLADGRVLAAGGFSALGPLANAEIYVP